MLPFAHGSSVGTQAVLSALFNVSANSVEPTATWTFIMNKSLSDFREVIAANSGKCRAHDQKFFEGLDARIDKLMATAKHPGDFRRLSNEVRAYGAALAAKDDWNAAIHAPVFDSVMAYADILDLRIETLTVANAAMGELGYQVGGDVAQNGWRNAKTGEPIKLYAPADRMQNSASPAVGIGELLQGMFFGTKSESVRNALSEGTDTAGGFTVPLEISRDFIDRLRTQSAFVQAGALTMPLANKTRIVRLDQDPTAAWRLENSSVGDSDLVLSAIELNPKSLSTLVKVSYELLDDSINIAEILTRALVGALATELDRACLFGSGVAPEPLGLFNTANINSVSMGTNGATPTTYDDLLDMMYELELDNAGAPTASIWHPRTARTYRKLKDTTGQPLVAPVPIKDLPKLSTTGVPITQTQGTAVGICSTVLTGDFTQAILGIREEIQIIRLSETYAANGQIAFWARMRADVGFAHGQSFCKLIGVKL